MRVYGFSETRSGQPRNGGMRTSGRSTPASTVPYADAQRLTAGLDVTLVVSNLADRLRAGVADLADSFSCRARSPRSGKHLLVGDEA